MGQPRMTGVSIELLIMRMAKTGLWGSAGPFDEHPYT